MRDGVDSYSFSGPNEGCQCQIEAVHRISLTVDLPWFVFMLLQYGQNLTGVH
jgi:hypothetical protein